MPGSAKWKDRASETHNNPLSQNPVLVRTGRERGPSADGLSCYPSYRRKRATAFWPPKPKALAMATFTSALRGVCGT